MQVLAHPDPFVLEDELLRRVAESLGTGALTRVLVIVPTARLAAHVRRRVAERMPACLGLSVLHHRALALEILDALPSDPPRRVASSSLLEALLSKILGELPENDWTAFLAERPTALSSLLGAVEELREARISPRTFLEHAGRRDQPLAEVYERYVDALTAARRHGFLDGSGLMAEATEEAAGFAERFAAVVHHGAYELIGVHLDLVRAIDRGCRVAYLLPCEPGAPVFGRAERFAREFLLERGETVLRLPNRAGGLLGDRVATLYDEEKRPEPAPEGTVRVRHAQGALAEVTVALRSSVAAAEKGVPATEVAILARSLAPYVVAIESAFEEEATLPWTSSLTSPLRRDPRVRDLLGILRVVADDFPRARTAELLRSPYIAWDAILKGVRPRLDLAEDYSRRAGIVSGLDEWRELPRWAALPSFREDDGEEERARKVAAAETRERRAQGIVRAVEALVATTGRAAPARWARHAARVRELVTRVRPTTAGDALPAVRAFLEHVDEMAGLELLLEDPRDVSFREMVDWLDRAVSGEASPVRHSDDGGFRVLDAMQARGLTFRAVTLLGFHSGLVPRALHEDPFLPDDLRARLRGAAGHPVTVKAEGESEERILLALLLASAKESIDVSWQRADEAGRSKSPLMALREVSRLVLGRPDLDGFVAGARRVSSHPAAALEDLLGSTGLLTAREEMLLLALRGGGDRLEKALLEREPGLSAGLRMLRATESFGLADATFDGRVGPAATPLSKLSVSALERLGRCPLQFFFRDRLGIVELEEEAGSFDLTIAEWGELLHRVLERTYRALAAEGLGDPDREDDLRARADAALEKAWEGTFHDVATRIGRHFPLLWRSATTRYLESLRTFVRADLMDMLREGSKLGTFEETRRVALDVGGEMFTIEGRFDRVRDVSGRAVIGDYKTSGKLKWRGEPIKMLRGGALQIPLYFLLTEGSGRVEVLGVGPDHDPARGVEDDDRRLVFEGFKGTAQHEGFLETARELIGLAVRGTFPLHDEYHCGFCPYRRACRRMHPPTRHREESWDDAMAYRDLQEKTQEKPLLAAIRARSAAEREGSA